MAKARYHIRNWKDYNRSLIQRGSITVWFSEDAIKKWHGTPTGNRGCPCRYSDDAILTALLIRVVFHLPLRALEGFLSSLVLALGICLQTPSYSQICHGEGEWKVRQHGYSKRRTWRKLHLAICPDSNEILFVKLTDNKTPDHKIYPEFVRGAPKSVKRTYGDGAYDRKICYRANHDHGSSAIIPPQRNGQWCANAPDYLLERNNSILEIKGLGDDEDARKLWKKLKGYHRRSLAETGMYRFKTLYGGDLKSRSFQGQQSEAYVKAKALNIMTRLGMPKSVREAA